jgi:hypothetical protein
VVLVPPGLRTRTFRGKRKNSINFIPLFLIYYWAISFGVTTHKFAIIATKLITNILLIWRVQFMEICCQGVRKWKKVGNQCFREMQCWLCISLACNSIFQNPHNRNTFGYPRIWNTCAAGFREVWCVSWNTGLVRYVGTGSTNDYFSVSTDFFTHVYVISMSGVCFSVLQG